MNETYYNTFDEELEETCKIGVCEECGNVISANDDECYVDEEGHYFDSVECVLEYFKVTKREL